MKHLFIFSILFTIASILASSCDSENDSTWTKRKSVDPTATSDNQDQTCAPEMCGPKPSRPPMVAGWCVVCSRNPKDNACSWQEACLSKRSAKEQVHYLSSKERQEIAARIFDLKLTTYRYKPEFGDPKELQMGFIIDDVNKGAPFILHSGDRVNLYGYISAAVIALQQQQSLIEQLQGRIEELETAKGSAKSNLLPAN